MVWCLECAPVCVCLTAGSLAQPNISYVTMQAEGSELPQHGNGRPRQRSQQGWCACVNPLPVSNAAAARLCCRQPFLQQTCQLSARLTSAGGAQLPVSRSMASSPCEPGGGGISSNIPRRQHTRCTACACPLTPGHPCVQTLPQLGSSRQWCQGHPAHWGR